MNPQGVVATIFLYICCITSGVLCTYYMYKVQSVVPISDPSVRDRRLCLRHQRAVSSTDASLRSCCPFYSQYQKKQCGWEGASRLPTSRLMDLEVGSAPAKASLIEKKI